MYGIAYRYKQPFHSHLPCPEAANVSLAHIDIVDWTISRHLSNNGHRVRKLSLATSFRSVRPVFAHAPHIQLTELAIDLDDSKFSAVAKEVILEVTPYLTNAHALKSTGNC